MNKKTKGAIAAGAAAALLAGGAGTFATWNDSAPLSGGSITAGKLQFVANSTAGDWYKGTDTSNEANKIPSISAFRIVPGQTLTYKASTKFIAEGTNLSATLTLDPGTAGTFEGLSWGNTTVTADGVAANGNITTFNATERDATIERTVTFSDVSGKTSQGANAALSGVELKLQQN